MKQIKLDKYGQVVIDNDFVMIDGEKELLQSIERIITTRVGEWFLGGIGVVYDDIQGKNVTYSDIEYELSRAIMTDERIEQIEKLIVYEAATPRNVNVDITIKDINNNYYEMIRVLGEGGVVVIE